jgi:hypothetical protein
MMNGKTAEIIDIIKSDLKYLKKRDVLIVQNLNKI